MFLLTPQELRLKILDCLGGASSFNAECNERMGQVVSLDPLYLHTRDKISEKIYETWEKQLEFFQVNRERYLWEESGSIMQLGNLRMAAMRKFLTSYNEGKKNRQYLAGELPDLRFSDQSFDLAVCSHFLFYYADRLDYGFHIQALQSLLRVAREVRVYPVVDQRGQVWPFLRRLLEHFKVYSPELRSSDFEFLKGAREMLVLRNVPPKRSEDDYRPRLRI